MSANPAHVFDHALLAVGDRQPVDVVRLGRAGSRADIMKSVGAEGCGLEAVLWSPAETSRLGKLLQRASASAT